MRTSLGRALALALIVAACDTLTNPASPAAPVVRPTAGPTIVSLTFDDGLATAYKVRKILAAHRLHATFYVNSGHVGLPGYMTWQQVRDLAADGNEIGGHTALHVDLPQEDPAEAERQICDDRVALFDHGHQATDFAYPFGASDPNVARLAEGCGYESARTTTHVAGVAEAIPPAQPYAIGIANGSPEPDAIEAAIRAALPTGGWVPILFHGVCDGCSTLSIDEGDLTALLDWLVEQETNGVMVRTVREVVGGPIRPALPGPPAPAPPNGANGLQNPSLEQDSGGVGRPDCWTADRTGDNTATWVRSTAAHSGAYALRAIITGYVDGDARLAVLEDLGQCTPSVLPGHRYVITAWYRSTRPVSFTAHTRTGTAFAYWTTSPAFRTADDWAAARWITPAIPDGVDGLSFGIAIKGDGALAVDDLGIDDAAR